MEIKGRRRGDRRTSVRRRSPRRREWGLGGTAGETEEGRAEEAGAPDRGCTRRGRGTPHSCGCHCPVPKLQRKAAPAENTAPGPTPADYGIDGHVLCWQNKGDQAWTFTGKTCWSWNSNSLAIFRDELTHWERPRCWERLKAGGEGHDRGWDGWMASLTQWTWVWVNSGSWWWTGRPGVLRPMGSHGHNWATDLSWTESKYRMEDNRFLM